MYLKSIRSKVSFNSKTRFPLTNFSNILEQRIWPHGIAIITKWYHKILISFRDNRDTIITNKPINAIISHVLTYVNVIVIVIIVIIVKWVPALKVLSSLSFNSLGNCQSKQLATSLSKIRGQSRVSSCYLISSKLHPETYQSLWWRGFESQSCHFVEIPIKSIVSCNLYSCRWYLLPSSMLFTTKHTGRMGSWS